VVSTHDKRLNVSAGIAWIVGARLRLRVLDPVPGLDARIHPDPVGDSATPR
jgi:hypothetical protein